MRVAIVTTSYPNGPADPSGHFVQAEARALEAAGHEVRVIAGEGSAFGWPGVAARLAQQPWRAFSVASWMGRAAVELRRGAFERVVAHWALPCAWPLAWVTAAPLEVVSHGGDVRALLALPMHGPLVRAIAERASVWRFVSEKLRRELEAGLDDDVAECLDRVARVGACAIEMPDVSAAIARRRAEHAGRGVVVAVGRLVASKRVERVIEHVAQARPRDLLVVVGDGPERTRLEAHARARRVDARFVGTVAREEALAWIGAADILVHASRVEGLSTVIREAEALGTPVKLVA
jgi:glycosyltransferase involved in cell wall biosynthesis